MFSVDQTAIIVYKDSAPLSEPTTVEAYENTVDDTQLAPLHPVTIGTPYKSIELGVFFDTFDNGVNRAAFNNSQ